MLNVLLLFSIRPIFGLLLLCGCFASWIERRGGKGEKERGGADPVLQSDPLNNLFMSTLLSIADAAHRAVRPIRSRSLRSDLTSDST